MGAGGRGEAWRRERYRLFDIMSKYGRISMFPQTEVEWSYRIWIWGLIAKDCDANMGDFLFFIIQSLFTRFKICTWIRWDVLAFFPLLKSHFLKSWAYQCAAVYIGKLGRILWNRDGRRILSICAGTGLWHPVFVHVPKFTAKVWVY